MKQCPKCNKDLIKTYGREYEVSAGWHSMDVTDNYDVCQCGYIQETK